MKAGGWLVEAILKKLDGRRARQVEFAASELSNGV
jgi:hypothetical protein